MARSPAPVTKDERYEDVMRVKAGQEPDYRTIAMELVWRCTRCGFQTTRVAEPPAICPSCGGPKEDFVALTED